MLLKQSSHALQPFLDRLLSRSLLSHTEQDAILDLPTSVVEVGYQKDFVRLGETVDHACFVVTGFVGRFDQNANGERQITAVHLPGDMPDLHSVVQCTATSALQALTPATRGELAVRVAAEIATHPQAGNRAVSRSGALCYRS